MAVLLGLLTTEQEHTTIPVNAANKNLAVFGVAIGLRKAELIGVKRQRPLNIFDKKYWSCVPGVHALLSPVHFLDLEIPQRSFRHPILEASAASCFIAAIHSSTASVSIKNGKIAYAREYSDTAHVFGTLRA
jgi:hypothetical protein